MNRTERLYAVAEELRRAGRQGTTGPLLARRLEVSERTIKRDISALQQAGLPIWAQAGPGGGYVLDEVASLPPVNFSPSQAVAVAVALATLPEGSPFSADARAAQGKVWDALGGSDRERAQRLAARVWSRPPEAAGREPHADPTVLRALEQSLASERVLAIRYLDGAGTESSRRVEPVILAHTGAHWYLVAWCQLRLAIRWFRVDRIARADLTSESYVPRPVAEAGEPPAEAAPVA